MRGTTKLALWYSLATLTLALEIFQIAQVKKEISSIFFDVVMLIAALVIAYEFIFGKDMTFTAGNSIKPERRNWRMIYLIWPILLWLAAFSSLFF